MLDYFNAYFAVKSRNKKLLNLLRDKATEVKYLNIAILLQTLTILYLLMR